MWLGEEGNEKRDLGFDPLKARGRDCVGNLARTVWEDKERDSMKLIFWLGECGKLTDTNCSYQVKFKPSNKIIGPIKQKKILKKGELCLDCK